MTAGELCQISLIDAEAETVELNGYLHAGDNLEYLRTLPDNSIDAIVTDPPYGLGKEPDPRKVLAAWLNDESYQPGGRGFMGKEWDAFVPSPVLWQECLRVLKPGGHMIAFAGTRTYDWVVMGVRLAGFEIRDTIAWLYGSGFPKSLNVSKAIDKMAGVEREVSATPEAQQWEGWGTALKPAMEPAVLARKPIVGTVAENVLQHGTGALNIDAARVAYEKDGSTASNPMLRREKGLKTLGSCGGFWGSGKKRPEIGCIDGRWPANVAHDGSGVVTSEFPTVQSGQPIGTKNSSLGYGDGWPEGIPVTGYGDSGSASRFFTQAAPDPLDAPLFKYCAKASTSERNLGMDAIQDAIEKGNIHPTVKPLALMEYLIKLVTPPGGTILDPFLGSGTTAMAAELLGFRWIGCELETPYAMIAHHRISHVVSNRAAILNARVKKEDKANGASEPVDRSGDDAEVLNLATQTSLF